MTLFLRLVQVGEGTRDTRERALLAGADPALRSVVERLARGDARLLVTSRDEGSGADAIEISHEALIPSWTWLRELVQQNRQFLAWRKHTRTAVRAYSERHDDAILLRGRYPRRGARVPRRARRRPHAGGARVHRGECRSRARERSCCAVSSRRGAAGAGDRGVIRLHPGHAQRGADAAAWHALQTRTDEFDVLAGVVQLRAAREKAATLYPAWPEKLAAMDEWLARDVPTPARGSAEAEGRARCR
jgi:hypothetical protein